MSTSCVNAPADEHTQPGNRRGSAVGAILQSMVARGAIIGLNAATGIITARSLNPQGRGEVSAMIIWPVLLSNAMTLGLPSALTYKLRSDRSKESQYVGSALSITVIGTALCALIAAFFLPRILHLYSPEVLFYARWFLVNAPIGILVGVCRAAFESRGDFSASTRALWLVPFLNLLGLVSLAITHTLTPERAAFVYVFAGTPVVVWVVAKLWREYSPTLRSFRASSRSLLDYGLRSYGIDLCGTLSSYVDQALVIGMLNAQAMGTYVVALSLSRMLGLCQGSVVMVLFPKAVGRSQSEIVQMAGTAARISTLCTACIGLFVALLGPTVLHVLYGRDYMVASPILRVLILEVILGGMTMVLAQAPMALGRPGVVTILQMIGLGLTVPLMMVLVPRFGILGAGYSLLISTACRLIFIAMSFKWFLKVPCPRLWLNGSDLAFTFSKALVTIPGLNRVVPSQFVLDKAA